jgi:rod shape determining protein RodA
MSQTKIWRNFDFVLLGGIALLVVLGVAMIRSAMLTSPDGGEREVSRQLLFAAIGAVIVFGISAIDYRLWGSLATSLYAVIIGLLLFVGLVGEAAFGANRWIPLYGGFNLQPAELGKFIMVLTLGQYLANHTFEVGKFTFVIKTLIHIGAPVVLIAMQPDISSCLLYGVIWFSLLWASGVKWEHVAIMAVVAFILGMVGFFIALNVEAAQYVARRIVFFALPNPDSKDYQDATYNVTQALISIGSGGWFGQGYANGSQVQLRFLKVRHTDYIFATIANEFGFIGAVVVIALFLFVFYRIFRAAHMARDLYGRLICFGVGMVLAFEVLTNIASNLNILPVSGAPLPLVSYGGSSLWTYLFGVGLVESVILRHKQIEF